VIIAASLIIQIASLAFWLPLEIYQMETLGHPTFVIALRFKNIAAFALGKMDAWGLNNESMTQDTWDYVILRRGIFCRSSCGEWARRPKWVVRLRSRFGERVLRRWPWCYGACGHCLRRQQSNSPSV